MILNISKQNELLKNQKQRKGTLKEIGFNRVLCKHGISLEKISSEDIEITEDRQKELKKLFENKYVEWNNNKSEKLLLECIGTLEALTFIGIKVPVPQNFVEEDLYNRCSSYP